MEVKAKLKYIKTAPRKVRLVLDCVRGLGVDDALNQLQFINKKVTREIRKLLNSAISNAINNFELERSNLFVKKIKADDGPTLKRWKPRARGRATPIRKRTTHVNIVLGELVDSGKKEAVKQEIIEPIKLDGKNKKEKGIKKLSTGKDNTKKDNKKEDTSAASTTSTSSEQAGSEQASSVQGNKETKELGSKIIDPREEGKGKNSKIEGSNQRGFVNKIFRRKSG